MFARAPAVLHAQLFDSIAVRESLAPLTRFNLCAHQFDRPLTVAKPTTAPPLHIRPFDSNSHMDCDEEASYEYDFQDCDDGASQESQEPLESVAKRTRVESPTRVVAAAAPVPVRRPRRSGIIEIRAHRTIDASALQLEMKKQCRGALFMTSGFFLDVGARATL